MLSGRGREGGKERGGRRGEEGVGREGGICVIGFRGDGRHWLG